MINKPSFIGRQRRQKKTLVISFLMNCHKTWPRNRSQKNEIFFSFFAHSNCISNGILIFNLQFPPKILFIEKYTFKLSSSICIHDFEIFCWMLCNLNPNLKSVRKTKFIWKQVVSYLEVTFFIVTAWKKTDPIFISIAYSKCQYSKNPSKFQNTTFLLVKFGSLLYHHNKKSDF